MNDQVLNQSETQKANSQPSHQISQIRVENDQEFGGGLVGTALGKALGEDKRTASVQGIEYTLPRTCCRCGEREGTENWGVVFTKKKTFVFSSKTTTYALRVLVCAFCYSELQKLRKRSSITALVGAVLVGAIAVLATLAYGWGDIICTVSLGLCGAMLGGYIGYFVGGGTTSLKLGWYDGKHFRFKNQEFQREFVELNPHLYTI